MTSNTEEDAVQNRLKIHKQLNNIYSGLLASNTNSFDDDILVLGAAT